MDSINTYLEGLKKKKLLTAKEERVATPSQLVSHNLRLVVSIAKRYSGRGLPLEDLIQEGNEGLMVAASKFDPKLQNRFSTYATYWINQRIDLFIKNHKDLIRKPVHTTDFNTKMRKAENILCKKLQRNPSIDELAVQMNESPEKITEALELNIAQPISIDSLLEDKGGYELLEDKESSNPEESSALTNVRKLVGEALKILSPREREIIRLRFGLDTGYDLSLKEVGKHFNITQERVRQIEARALKKIRKSYRTENLKELVS